MNVNSSFVRGTKLLPVILLFFTTSYLFGECRSCIKVFEFQPKSVRDTIPLSVENPTPSALVSVESDVYRIVEQQPEYPGGTNVLMKWIASELTYPAQARRKGIEGTIYVSFVIEKDGSVSSPEVRNSSKRTKTLEKEAVRVVKMMPNWIPGKQKGEPVRVLFTMPLKFQLY